MSLRIPGMLARRQFSAFLCISLPLLLLTTAGQMPAQTSGELFRTIAALDTEVFEAYNNCNLEKFRSFFVDGLEFYHDLGGLTVGGDKVTEQVKNNICGKVRRELVAGTLQVYPMQGYGALETGSHRFFPAAKGSESSGIAKFIHLWEKKDGVWKITRVISYDHKSQQK